MSDLISREALIKELETFDEEFELQIDEVYALITNAPAIERGEAVTKLWESIGRWSAYLASNGEQAELSPPSWLIDAVKNATTPQQPQEQGELVKKAVADALEELERALCLIGVVGNVDGHDVIRRDSVINVARQRIKRNAKEGE